MKKLLVVMMAVMAVTGLLVTSSFGADKLIVKDSGGTITKFVVTDAGTVGVNTATPSWNIEAANEAANASVGLRVSSSSGGVPAFFGTRSSGTLASPSATASGQGLFWLGAMGHDGSGWSSTLTGLIGFHASENWSSTNKGTEMRFFTTPNGSSTRAERIRVLASGNVGIGTTAPARLFSVGTGGAGSDGSTWFTSSSREYKDNIQELTAEKALEAVKSMTPVTFVYKEIPNYNHVGFIAEDVPNLVATPDRKSLSAMDIVAVLTKVVQEQSKTIEALSAKVDMLEKATIK